jgi:hypothetical protein
LLVSLIVFGTALSGCGLTEGDRRVSFENRTLRTLTIVYVAASGDEVVLATNVSPGRIGGHDWVAAAGCLPANSVTARDELGQEVARRQEELCALETWIIE